MSEEIMIEIKDVWKSFGNLAVLQGLNAQIRAGETLVILGRSGVGKSVLLKHIMGLLPPDRGEIIIHGKSISSLKGSEMYLALLHMGMLFQGAALFDSMNIEENVGFFLSQHGDVKTGKKLSKKEIEERVNEALEMVGLAGVQKKIPSELSGGMRKRAALARLIVYRPTVILYDEPTTGLDPITSMQINQLIVKIQKELNATSIVVTHDMTSALVVGDRLALHKDGKLAYIEEPDAFLKISDPIIDFLRKSLFQDPRTFKESAL